ncbi:Rmf/CrpP fold protein [Streptomyces flavusporus]
MRTILAGQEAGRRQESPLVCPYPRTSILRRAWIRGYARAHGRSQRGRTTTSAASGNVRPVYAAAGRKVINVG